MELQALPECQCPALAIGLDLVAFDHLRRGLVVACHAERFCQLSCPGIGTGVSPVLPFRLPPGFRALSPCDACGEGAASLPEHVGACGTGSGESLGVRRVRARRDPRLDGGAQDRPLRPGGMDGDPGNLDADRGQTVVPNHTLQSYAFSVTGPITPAIFQLWEEFGHPSYCCDWQSRSAANSTACRCKSVASQRSRTYLYHRLSLSGAHPRLSDWYYSRAGRLPADIASISCIINRPCWLPGANNSFSSKKIMSESSRDCLRWSVSNGRAYQRLFT